MEIEFIKELLNDNLEKLKDKYPDSKYFKILKFHLDSALKEIKNHKENFKNEIKQELVENYKSPPSYICDYRTVGVNQYKFRCNESFNPCRANTHYYSNDFEEVLKKYITESGKNTISSDEILGIFLKEKDNLKHLSFKTVGYY